MTCAEMSAKSKCGVILFGSMNIENIRSVEFRFIAARRRNQQANWGISWKCRAIQFNFSCGLSRLCADRRNPAKTFVYRFRQHLVHVFQHIARLVRVCQQTEQDRPRTVTRLLHTAEQGDLYRWQNKIA